MIGNFDGPDSPWVRPGAGKARDQHQNPQGSDAPGEQPPAPGPQPESSPWSDTTQHAAFEPGSTGNELHNDIDQDVETPPQPGEQEAAAGQQPGHAPMSEASEPRGADGHLSPDGSEPAANQAAAGATPQHGWGQDGSASPQPDYGQGFTDGTQQSAYAAGPPAGAAAGAAAGANAWQGGGQPGGQNHFGQADQSGGQPPTGPHQTGAPSATPPGGGKPPWYKRPLVLVLGIVGVLVLILAAVGIPLAIHFGNVARGDQLADDFNTALEAHNATWTQDEIANLNNVVVSEALQENADFYSQSAASMADLQTRCDGVETAASSLETLAASPVPTLEDANGADASAKYQEAMSISDGLADRRAAVDTLTTEGTEAIGVLGEFCTVYPQYNSILNALGQAIDTIYLPTLTIPNGSTIDFGNDLILECTMAAGCPNYADQAARTAYGDAIDASFTTFYTDLAAQAGTACFLPDFADVCATMQTEYDATGQAYATSAESIRTEQPNLTVGQLPFPNFFPQFQAANDRSAEADSAVNATWQSVDPGTAGDTASGWQARSLKAALAGYETSITDAVAQLG